jgi:methyl-accepting chemotaxis protein
MSRKLNTVGLIALILIIGASALAQDDAAALAAESAAYCNSTAQEGITSPDVITAQVAKACSVLEKEGVDAFAKFQGEGSEFLYEGTYMWIQSLDNGNMLMHPMKPKLNGKNVIGLKDKKGKRFFSTMNKMVKANGNAWVEYYWPKPGSKEIVHKVSYVKGCTLPDGQKVVVGSGLYRFNDSTLANLEIH